MGNTHLSTTTEASSPPTRTRIRCAGSRSQEASFAHSSAARAISSGRWQSTCSSAIGWRTTCATA
eukprot:525281-Alexandrium_andersonii.AAC.1